MFTPLVTLFNACFAGIAFLYSLPNNLKKTYQVGGLWVVFIAVGLGCGIFNLFSLDALQFQFLSENPWLTEMRIALDFGLDGISLVFLALTVVIFPFCVLASWKVKEVKFLFINLLLIEFFLVLTFTTLDLFLFCLFFESLLIPMFFIILLWGSRDRRIKALTYFVLYTLFGSIFLITALFILYTEATSTGFGDLLANKFQGNRQSVFWMLLFITFSIKIPMFPFHIWLPEAHVEAPTVGSVILAGLLLKLGAYGMLRFLFVFDTAKLSFQPYVFALCLISVFLASFIAIRQLDMKRIIAYSSIAHMNFALLGYFSNNLFGMTGGTLLMVSHGLVSSALFLLIGVLYERYHTRSVLYYGGLVTVMPLFATFFFMFTISNFSFPGTSNFVGELLVFIGLGLTPAKLVLILGSISTFFGLVYSLLLYNRVTFGNLKYTAIQKFTDITRREYSFLVVLLVLSTLMGLIPNSIIESITAGLTALTHNTTAMLSDVITTSVDTATALAANGNGFTSATTGEWTKDKDIMIQIALVMHDFFVSLPPEVTCTWEMLYTYVTTEFPTLKSMSMPEFKVYTDGCLWAFVGAAQNAGLLHFSEVTWFVSCFEYLGRLPMGVIHKTHFWLALQASIGVDAPSIVRAYQVLTTFSNYLCTTEFWTLAVQQLGEYLQHLVETNNTKELEILKEILEKVHAELTEEVIKDVKRQIVNILEILRKSNELEVGLKLLS